MVEIAEFIIGIVTVITMIAIGCIIEFADKKIMKNIYQTEKPIENTVEKRYVYTILGRELPSNLVLFKIIENDTKLTYQQIKDKFPSVEILSINVLDKNTGKF
jgi:hypothetical protein